MAKKYIITDFMCGICGSSDDITEAIQIMYDQLDASIEPTDSRTLNIRAEGGVHTPIGTYRKTVAGINWNVAIIRKWREERKAVGLPYTLSDYYKLFNRCPKCKGNKVTAGPEKLPCDYCQGAGCWVPPPTGIYKLIVRERLKLVGGQGVGLVETVLDEGPLLDCLKCYSDVKHAYMSSAQFIIEDPNGFVVGIRVHGAILWLPNVPNPKYFKKPAPKPEQKETDESTTSALPTILPIRLRDPQSGLSLELPVGCS